MASQVKQLSKHFLVFGFGEYLKGTIAFLLIPLYTRYLTPNDYGQLELLMATLSIFFIVVTQGVPTAFLRSYAFAGKEHTASVRDLVSTSYLYLAVSAIGVSAILYLFSGQYGAFLFGKEHPSGTVIKIVALTLCFQVLMLIPYEFLRAKLESFKYITLSLTQFLFQVFLNIYFVVALGLGLTGILLGNAISSLLIVGATFFIVRGYLTFKISKAVLTDLLTFGLPLIMTSVFIFVLQMSDRFFIQKLSTTHELGLYSLGYRFASILPILVVIPFQKIWGSMAFQIAAEDGAQESFKRITTYFFLSLSIVGVLLILWAPLAIRLMTGEEFWDAQKVVPLLVLSQVGYGMLSISSIGLYIAKKTKYIPLIVLAGAAVNIGLNLAFIPKYGMIGAALSALITYLVMNVIFHHVGQKIYRIPFDRKRLVKIASIFLGICLLSCIQCSSQVVDGMYRILLMLLFAAGFAMSGFFEREELLHIRHSVHQLQEAGGLSDKLKYVFNSIRR